MGQWVKNRLNFNLMEDGFKFSILAPFFQIYHELFENERKLFGYLICLKLYNTENRKKSYDNEWDILSEMALLIQNNFKVSQYCDIHQGFVISVTS